MPTRKHGKFEPWEDTFCPLPPSRVAPASRFSRGFRRALATGLGAAGAALHGRTGIRSVYWMLGTAAAPRSTGTAAPDGDGPPGGAAHPEPVAGNHSPHYAPDVRTALPTGIEALAAAVRAVAPA